MNLEDIMNKLQSIFRDVFDDETIILKKEMSAKDIDEWDSLTHIQLIVATETDFGIHFMTAEISELQNVGEFLILIEKKLRGKDG